MDDPKWPRLFPFELSKDACKSKIVGTRRPPVARAFPSHGKLLQTGQARTLQTQDYKLARFMSSYSYRRRVFPSFLCARTQRRALSRFPVPESFPCASTRPSPLVEPHV